MRSNWKILLFTISIVTIVGLGGVFLIGKSKFNDQLLSKDKSEGTVSGANTIGDNGFESPDYVQRLAKELASRGMFLYGTYQCSECKAQMDLFGASAKYLDYVECDAAVPSANPDECRAQEIDTYPTWLFNGQKYKGVLSLSDLAKIIGFKE